MAEQLSPASTDLCQQPSAHPGQSTFWRGDSVQGTCPGGGGRAQLSSASRDRTPPGASSRLRVLALAVPLSPETWVSPFTPVILCFLICKVHIIIIPTKYLGFIVLIKVSSIKAFIYFHLFGCSKNIYCMPTLCQASRWVWYLQLPKELRY